MIDKRRLDLELEARGMMPSRARARDAILRGTIQVNGTTASKPNQQVTADDAILVADPAAGYASRAALKLLAGLDAADIPVSGRVCLDVGSSTGGFTQVLLERGAARVYAVDVGRDQLVAPLRSDARVVLLEDFNARDLTSVEIADPIDLLVCDVSFVSVEKVLGPALTLCATGAHAVILFKPQFEVGRENVGKGGIVTDEAAIAEAKARVIGFIEGAGFRQIAETPSPIAGGDGNREIVQVFARTG